MPKKIVKLTILGEPMGKQRPRATTINGRVRTYTPKETTNYESMVVNAYKSQFNEKIFQHGEEVWATVIAYFKLPKNHYHFHKRTNTLDIDEQGKQMLDGKIRPMKTPDCDNIAKICLDALNDIAYLDDSQITCLLVLKFWSEHPRVEITLESQEGED